MTEKLDIGGFKSERVSPTSNITKDLDALFQSLVGGELEGRQVCLASCFVNEEPSAALCLVAGDDEKGYVVKPMFVAITPAMKIVDHEGVAPGPIEKKHSTVYTATYTDGGEVDTFTGASKDEVWDAIADHIERGTGEDLDKTLDDACVDVAEDASRMTKAQAFVGFHHPEVRVKFKKTTVKEGKG